MKLLPLLFLAACASDPYLQSTLDCVAKASSRAQADACRAALQDAGPDVADAPAGKDVAHE